MPPFYEIFTCLLLDIAIFLICHAMLMRSSMRQHSERLRGAQRLIMRASMLFLSHDIFHTFIRAIFRYYRRLLSPRRLLFFR